MPTMMPDLLAPAGTCPIDGLTCDAGRRLADTVSNPRPAAVQALSRGAGISMGRKTGAGTRPANLGQLADDIVVARM
jgi:hypothetical protein